LLEQHPAPISSATVSFGLQWTLAGREERPLVPSLGSLSSYPVFDHTWTAAATPPAGKGVSGTEPVRTRHHKCVSPDRAAGIVTLRRTQFFASFDESLVLCERERLVSERRGPDPARPAETLWGANSIWPSYCAKQCLPQRRAMYPRTRLTGEERIVLARVKQRNDRLRRAARTPEQIELDRRTRHPDGTKHCNRCGRDLAFDQFAPFPREPDGLYTHCIECKPPADRTTQGAEEAGSLDYGRFID